MKGRYFSWQQAVAKEEIQPGTKLVLFVILNYFTESGGLIAPDLDRLVTESGLTRDVFISHLSEAHQHGFTELTSKLLQQIEGAHA